MSKIILTEDFKKALNVMQNSWDHLFISGKAGTGKSTLLKEFILREDEKKYAVVAPTGVAAMNVEGSTIHSFFRFPAKYMGEIPTKFLSRKNEKVLNRIEMLIIDEISMVRVDLMDAIDRSLRKNRRSNLPFGGIQVIFIGDLLQLPPVVPKVEKQKIFNQFGGEFFFDAPVMKEIDFKFVELEKIFRQNKKEGDFKDALNRIREGKTTAKDLHFINKNIPPFLTPLSSFKKILAYIYKIITFGSNKFFNKWSKVEEKDIMKICSNNEQVYGINTEYYKNLQEEEFIFFAELKGKIKETAEKYKWLNMTEKEQFIRLKDKTPAPLVLKIKKGAKIMMTNNDSAGRWVNGSLGYVEDIKNNTVIINLSGKLHTVKKETFETIQYIIDENNGELRKKIESEYIQFPIRLAWAITVHKSQGLSFNEMVLENNAKMFAEGQVYVALSRCRSIKTLYIRKPLSSDEILIHGRVVNFYRKIEQKES